MDYKEIRLFKSIMINLKTQGIITGNQYFELDRLVTDIFNRNSNAREDVENLINKLCEILKINSIESDSTQIVDSIGNKYTIPSDDSHAIPIGNTII